MGKAYVCNRYKSLGIVFQKRVLQFKNGLFVADTPEEEKAIEGVRGYGIYIHPQKNEAEAGIQVPVEAVSEPRLPQPRSGHYRRKVRNAAEEW